MSEELLRCPFCRGVPVMHGWDGHSKTAPEVWISCKTCGASTDTFVGPERAEYYWNSRAPAEVSDKRQDCAADETEGGEHGETGSSAEILESSKAADECAATREFLRDAIGE